MSMLTSLADRLREAAKLYDHMVEPMTAALMREAADTIISLRDRLQAAELRGTCEYKPMWNDDDLITGEYVGMWYTGCGDALIWNADNDECCKPPAFCPYCGGKVKAVEQ